MSGQHRWALGLATSTGLFGLTLTGSLAVLAHYFVEEFSRPHTLLPESAFSWELPKAMGDPPPALQRSLLFRTADGTLLCGTFWAQPRPAPTIILCHGYRVSSVHLRPAAALEYACGYNVLFFDFRGHGASDSVLTSAGNAEVRDLEAALFVARQQPETLPGKIIIHGFSMGASVALLTSPQPDVIAIIADSPYARSDDIMRRLINLALTEGSVHWHPLLATFRFLIPIIAWCTVLMSAIVFRLRFGFNVVARPDTSFKRWKTRSHLALQQHSIPILLIHCTGDTLIPIAHAKQLAAEARANGVPLETHFVEEGEHCGAFGYNPQQYNALLRDFLARHLQDDLPEQHRGMAIG